MRCSRCGGHDPNCYVCAPEEEYVEEDGMALAKEQEYFDEQEPPTKNADCPDTREAR